MNNNKFEVEVG